MTAAVDDPADTDAEVTQPAATITVTEPSVYLDMPDATYHADPVIGRSLSHSGAKALLPPSTPAMFKHYRDNGRPPKQAFDFGHAAHKKVLGVGAEIVGVDAADWRTKKAQEQAKEIRARGAIPLLQHQVTTVEEMAAALREHPTASKLLRPDLGTPEVSFFWRDDLTGICLRCRIDWLPHAHDGRMILVDYKTTDCADPDKFGKAAMNFSYYMQDPWYRTAVRACTDTDDVAFLFVVQEKTPPYLVNVIQLDVAAHRIGGLLRRRAIGIYQECTDSGEWPGYGDNINPASLPAWFERQYEEDLIA